MEVGQLYRCVLPPVLIQEGKWEAIHDALTLVLALGCPGLGGRGRGSSFHNLHTGTLWTRTGPKENQGKNSKD